MRLETIDGLDIEALATEANALPFEARKIVCYVVSRGPQAFPSEADAIRAGIKIAHDLIPGIPLQQAAPWN